MTAKEYLQQIRRINIIIKHKTDELNSFRSTLPLLPSQDLSSDRVQTSAACEAEYTRSIERILEMEAEIDRYKAARDKILSQIHGMSNINHMQVLYKRYVECKRLETIAHEVGYSYTRIKHLHVEALKKFESRHPIALLSVLQ